MGLIFTIQQSIVKTAKIGPLKHFLLYSFSFFFQDLLSLAMVKGDAGIDIVFTLLAGGLITKETSLRERIKKMPGSLL